MRRTLTLATTVAALAATALAFVLAGPASATPYTGRHTVAHVVRPVHRDGSPVAGWTVNKQKIPDFTCDGTSPVAVDDGIYFCGPSATYTVACWRSAKHTVLCLRDPFVKKLVRIRYTGTLQHVSAPDEPSPQALVLFGGTRCLIRDGGAWGAVKGHPKWIGYYSCDNGTSVYGRTRDGIMRASQPWRVHTVRFRKNGTQTIRTRQIRTVYYVGTAA